MSQLTIRLTHQIRNHDATSWNNAGSVRINASSRPGTNMVRNAMTILASINSSITMRTNVLFHPICRSLVCGDASCTKNKSLIWPRLRVWCTGSVAPFNALSMWRSACMFASLLPSCASGSNATMTATAAKANSHPKSIMYRHPRPPRTLSMSSSSKANTGSERTMRSNPD